MFSSIFQSSVFRRSTAASTSIAGLLTVAVSANAWVANNAFAVSVRRAIAPATRTTLAEAAPSRASFSSSSNNNSNDTKHSADEEDNERFSYGRPFSPQDVYYDSQVKDALEKLRGFKRDNVDVDADADVDTDNESNTTTTTTTTGLLSRSGRKYMGTLSLIGYKGGPLESQINQDRAVVVSPFWVGNEEIEKRPSKYSFER